ncbi:MAG: cytochrome c [Porticoccaceae bacterium]
MNSARLILAAGIAAFIAGCGEKGPEFEDPSIAAGEELFMQNCSECHPRRGRSDYLERIPATLLTRKSQNELMEWIKGSEKHREMPSFDNLSDEERASLANYLESQILK